MSDSIAIERLDWYLDRIRDGCEGVADQEIAAAWVCEPPFVPAPIRRGLIRHFATALRSFSVRDLRARSPQFAEAALEDERRRTWRAWAYLEAAPPHRIRQALVSIAPAPGVVLRPAQPEDAAAARDLERRSPIVMGDVRSTYDRGEDYFASARLIGGVYPMLAERDGQLLGMHCMVTHPLRVDGRAFAGTYLHHSRILPDAQGGGVFSALNSAELERNVERAEIVYAYTAAGNAAAKKIVPAPSWKMLAERLVIDCRAQAGAAAGRPARAEDAARIVALVNAAHGREELFVPYTRERLTERLHRDASVYGWSQLLLGERAAVGVWPAAMRIARETPAGREESVRALVLDTGFEPGAEGELVALVRASCAALARGDITHLTLFTSPASPANRELRALAARVEPYELSIGWAEPADIAERGLYVDHLYF